MLNIPDLNKLRIFCVVYENGSLVRAAHALNVTRSAVSQSLKSLEDELHTTLFARDSKKVRPTPAADSLFKLMSPFLHELQSTLHHLDTGRSHPVGHLRIGAPLDFSSDPLTEIVAGFREKHPGVTFELIPGVPVRQLDLLIEGKIDIAFIDNGNVFEKNYPISVETVWQEEFVLVSSSRFHGEKIKGDHSLAHLRTLPVVDYLPHAPVFRMWLKHHFGKSISDVTVAYSAETVRAVLKALSSGMGIGVVPAHMAKSDKTLRTISTTKKELVNRISLALPLSKKPTLTEKAFLSFAKELISSRQSRA